jgi:hypothetical protein
MLHFIIHQFCLAKFFISLKETSESGTKNPSVKPGTKGRWPKEKNMTNQKERSPAIAVITGLLIKDGGLLLSRIALQYHRRRRA